MKINDLVESARPILWQNDYIEYPYTIGASSFLISYQDEFYVVTAHHNLKGYTPDQLLIPYDPLYREFLPLEAAFRPPPNSQNIDTEYSDLLVLKVKRSLLKPEHLVGNNWFDVHFEKNVPEIPIGGSLIIAGYPISMQEIKYKTSSILRQRFICDGKYQGSTESNFSASVEFSDLNSLPDSSSGDSMSGLSGSPVFYIDRSVRPSAIWFAGTLVRGTKASLKGRYLTRQLLWKVLEHIQNKTWSEVDSL